MNDVDLEYGNSTDNRALARGRSRLQEQVSWKFYRNYSSPCLEICHVSKSTITSFWLHLKYAIKNVMYEQDFPISLMVIVITAGCLNYWHDSNFASILSLPKPSET